jgi:tetratricopeptide (TPR) repeat protein
MSSISLVATALISCALTGAAPGDDEEWIGEKFMPREGCVVKNGEKSIPLERLIYPLVVSKVEGDRVWIGRGWVEKSQLVPLDEAVSYYTALLRQQTENAWAYCYRGISRSFRGQPEEAADDLDKAIASNPKLALAMAFRGGVHDDRQSDQELKLLARAIQVDPQCVSAYRIRAHLLYPEKPAEAMQDATKAIELDPHDALSFFTRGLCHYYYGAMDKANVDFETVVRLDPKHIAGWLLLAANYASASEARYRNGKRAIECATAACELTRYSRVEALSALVAAHAEVGDFVAAIKWQSKSLELRNKQDKTLEEEQRKLQLYEDMKPFHEPKFLEVQSVE